MEATIEEIEKNIPGEVTYHIYKDAGRTGRFEITLYKGVTNAEGDGELIHSKASAGGFPSADWGTFLEMLKGEIE